MEEKETMEQVFVFDTTLRDGEQTPGAKMNAEEKLIVAKQLEVLGVDIVEAGFPVSSPGDLKAVQLISREVKKPIITALARSTKDDIDIAYEAVKDAQRPRIHVFLATSKIHMEHKYKKAQSEILDQAVRAVKYAKTKVNDVEFSPEDASRTELPFLAQVVEAAINAGATTVNIPDTVGYTEPDEYSRILQYLSDNVPDFKDAIISVHCHNDLGLATANSLAAVKWGARQVECTINGIGERAGNASLEEIVMGIKKRQDRYGVFTNIKTEEIIKTSRLVSRITGILVQPNKAIVGANAFAHSSGIHMDGILKHKATYEIIDPKEIGIDEHTMVLTARSGRHAVKNRLKQLGYDLSEKDFEPVFKMFLSVADQKKEVFDDDLHIIVQENIIKLADPRMAFELLKVSVKKGLSDDIYKVQIVLTRNGKEQISSAEAGGVFNAIFDAIDKVYGFSPTLEDFEIKALTKTREAIANAYSKASMDSFVVGGKGYAVDTIRAGAKSYVEMCNKILCLKENGNKKS